MSEAAVMPAAPGWFGKMPALGDFASRRLPPAFVDGWHDWLQRELARSRATLGEQWLDAFLVAPLRRYWIAPGVLGAGGWAGVWMPSVDAVGRHFPFTLAAACSAPGARPLARDAAAWFDALDAAARQVLDPDCRIDAFEQSLSALAPPGFAVAASALAAPGFAAAASAVAAPCSQWWCEGAASPAQLVQLPGLPAGDAFDALLRPCP